MILVNKILAETGIIEPNLGLCLISFSLQWA